METRIIVFLFLTFLIIDQVQKIVIYSIKIIIDDIVDSPDMHAKLKMNKLLFNGRNMYHWTRK